MYYVLGDGGSKYGPADLDTLKQWAAENRILPTMMLEDANTGIQLPAGQVPGLFPAAGGAAPDAGGASAAPGTSTSTTSAPSSSSVGSTYGSPSSSSMGSTYGSPSSSSSNPADPLSGSPDAGAGSSSTSGPYQSPTSSSSSSSSSPSSPYSSSSSSSSSPYGASQSPYERSPYGAAQSGADAGDAGKGFMIGSWVCGSLGLLLTCCLIGPIFSIVGIILGFIGKSKGNQVALFAAIFSIVTLLISGGYTVFAATLMRTPEFQRQFQQEMERQQSQQGGGTQAAPAPEGTSSL